MTRLLAALHDPWMAICLATARPGLAVATFGDARHAALLAALTDDALVLPPPEVATTQALLDDERAAAFIAATPSLLLSFKPAARLEARAAALGARFALPPAALAGALENKLRLTELAEGIALAPSLAFEAADRVSWADLTALGPSVVVQSPRGFAGRKTWPVQDPATWEALRHELGPRPIKVTRRLAGRPATVNCVVDRHGAVLSSAPIVQFTGVPWLTRQPLGSCGNDFTWRGPTDPADAVAAIAARFGAALARRGYAGHFGLDLLVGDEVVLIEVNPRLTASFALYSGWRPALLDAHLAAVDGGAIEPGALPPLAGGQLLSHPVPGGPGEALAADRWLPPSAVRGETVWPAAAVADGDQGLRGRLVGRGVFSDPWGEPATAWRPA